jgi:hypothetical protein
MKNTFFTLVVLFGFLAHVYSQKTAGSAIPPFKILLTNGSYYTPNDIEKNKPFILIYFAPDCDHCTVLLDKLFQNMHQLDNASVALVTFRSPAELLGVEKNTIRLSIPTSK